VPDGATVLVLDLGARTTSAAVVRSGADGVELLAAAESAEPLAGELLDDLLAPYVHIGQCRAVRERLSVEQAAAVPGEEGRLTRAAAEELFRPVLGAVLDLAQHVCRPFGRPDVVLLAGGLAHTPLVVELAHAVGRPVVVADPATAAARGAAHVAHRLAVPPRVPIKADEPAAPGVPELPDTPPRPPVDLEPLAVPRRGARRWLSPTLARRPGGDR
jgi:molecular chaperone DnaK (HSP70)